tara:strand:- start:26213 stop:27391 length:1179 start_codon:yes stop_codon:yes gene_type:complete
MSEETNENSLDGFKNLAADIIPTDNIEVKEVTEVPEQDLTETLGADTGIKDLTKEQIEDTEEVKKDTKEEKKEDLNAGNLEIAYKKEVPEGESTEEDLEEEQTQDSEVSQLGVIANFLKEEGIVDFEEEEFDDSEEGFQTLIQNEIKKGIEKYKTDLDPLAQEFIEYVDKGGNPQDFVKATSDVDFSKIDDKMIDGKENLQKQLVAELMRRDGFTQEEISADIQDFVDGGLIAKRATRALSKLKQMQTKDRQNLLRDQDDKSKQKAKDHQEFLVSLKEDIDTREEIAGFGISKKAKKDFYNYITEVDRKTGKTRLVSDSEADKDSQLKMAWLYYNKFNFSKIEKKARTKATSSLKANLERASNISTKKLKSKTRTHAEGTEVDFSLFENALK